MKVYGHSISTCTRKVLTALHEKGQKAELVIVDVMKGDQKNPDNLARQPFGQIPTLEVEGFVLYESRAIIRYLDETLPGPKLTPGDAKGRGLMEQWMSVETSNFTPNAMKIIYERYFHPLRGIPSDEKVVSDASVVVGNTLDVLDRQLAKTRYLTGTQFTLADICYMPYIEYLFAGKAGDLVTSRKNASRWWTEISSRDSWKAVAGK